MHAASLQLKDRIFELSIRKRYSNLSIVFFVCLFFCFVLFCFVFSVSYEEKYCYRVVSVGQFGLTAPSRTAGTATVVLNKSFFRNFILVLSWEV